VRLGIGGGSRLARGGVSVGRGGVRGGIGSGPFSLSGGMGFRLGGASGFGGLLTLLVVGAILVAAFIAVLAIPVIALLLVLPGLMRWISESGKWPRAAVLFAALLLAAGGFLLALFAYREFEISVWNLTNFDNEGPWGRDSERSYMATVVYAVALGGVAALPAVFIPVGAIRFWLRNYRTYRLWTVLGLITAIAEWTVGDAIGLTGKLWSGGYPDSLLGQVRAYTAAGLFVGPIAWLLVWIRQYIACRDDGSICVGSHTPIANVTQELGIDFNYNRYAMVDDLLRPLLCDNPKSGDSVEFEGLNFRVLHVDQKGYMRIEITPLERPRDGHDSV